MYLQSRLWEGHCYPYTIHRLINELAVISFYGFIPLFNSWCFICDSPSSHFLAGSPPGNQTTMDILGKSLKVAHYTVNSLSSKGFISANVNLASCADLI